MQSWWGRAKTRAKGVGALWLRGVLIAACGLGAAACTTTGSRPGQNATVAFESIDGPPPATFRKLVQKLNEEAEARKVPVVSRESAGALPHPRLCRARHPEEAKTHDRLLGLGRLRFRAEAKHPSFRRRDRRSRRPRRLGRRQRRGAGSRRARRDGAACGLFPVAGIERAIGPSRRPARAAIAL